MIDDYPAACAAVGQVPNEPASEVLVPVAPEIYAKASRRAERDGVQVSKVMETALEKFVARHA